MESTAKVISFEDRLKVINGKKKEKIASGQRSRAGERKTMTPFTLEEIEAITQAAKIWVSDAPSLDKLRYRSSTVLGFIIGINCGLRASDLILLKWSDFFYDETTFTKMVQIVEQKTGKRKNFPLNNAVKDAICWYLETVGGIDDLDGWVFASRQRNPKTGKYGHISLDTLAKRNKELVNGVAQIKRQVATHNMRKTFAHQQILAHRDDAVFMEVLSQLLNHSDVKVTRRYAMISEAEYEGLYNDVNLGNIKD